MATASKTAPMNVIIVDDETDACKNLQKILVEYVDPGINILGIAHNTAEAEKQILEHNPDVVFLDIDMPNENAFEFLDRIPAITFEVIFVTAYDEYAIRAFKLNAVDYILKPVSIDEVADAVKKAQERLGYRKIMGRHGMYGQLPGDIKGANRLDKIRLKDNIGFEIVDFKDIFYVEAKGSYSNIYFLKEDGSEKCLITSHSLNEYEEMLPMTSFCRIHRSYLVNCIHVKKVIADDNSFVLMKGKRKLPVSRRRITELMEFFKDKK
jgi:two-component system, LytTR family, response regulator